LHGFLGRHRVLVRSAILLVIELLPIAEKEQQQTLGAWHIYCRQNRQPNK